MSTSDQSLVEPRGAGDDDESLESLYEDAPCGYLSSLPDGTIVRINRTMLAWTRHRREQLLGSRFQELLSIGSRIFYETHYAPLLAMQGAVSELALEILRGDGSTFPVLVNSVVHRDGSGRARVVRTMVFDASDRRSYERELLRARSEAQRAAKAKADFVAMLSHDLRTPLSALMSMVDALEHTELSPAQQKYVRLLRAGSDALLSLANDVLEDSRFDDGRISLELSTFDLPTMVRETVERLRVTAEEKGLELWISVDERIPGMLIGDPVKIDRIFTNVLANALKFTEQGWVGVSLVLQGVAEHKAHIEATILDTGIGIDPARASAVFDEFTQVHDRRRRSYGGAGLGLAISKKLVELHGGTIGVRRREGGGTIFHFSLHLTLP